MGLRRAHLASHRDAAYVFSATRPGGAPAAITLDSGLKDGCSSSPPAFILVFALIVIMMRRTDRGAAPAR